ncbi:hypothetical protein A3K82_02010 [Candidatus Pacearchaeota archaeon RBG_19FT_COMBO_34_9]|nr:MAG: hypothetical protein A3K82_02010 [Candidatus Pacearchaeota archaeon RBG_19FT_COMBO_34_9]OGJ15926.1 MAG: hypothetical protein A3K74_02395 [Candidatus Pacearchaeota archaeon RBG_13_33_26]
MKNKKILIIGIILSISLIFFGILRILFYHSGIGGYVFIFYGLAGVLIFSFMIFNKKEYKMKILVLFTVCYFIIGSGLVSAYLYTHTNKMGFVPPKIYVRVLDSEGKPVENAICFADIETEKGLIEDKLLESKWALRELGCYGREACKREDFSGYYKLDIYNYTYSKISFLPFFKYDNLIYGDFEIKIVCRTADSVSYTIMNQTNFPCSPVPLTGNYVAPSFICSNRGELINKYFYDFDESEFDEYDALAIDFIKKNYQNKTVLSNNKLAIKLDDCGNKAYSCGIKPVGIMRDKKGYGDPYFFTDFLFASCEWREKIVKNNKIDLILSRFELEKCDFMKEVYSEKDYIYEVLK